MSLHEEDQLELAIPTLAVEALSAAHLRSIQAGNTLVLVQNGVLVRRSPAGVTVLKQLPARQKVSTRIKKAAS